MAELLELEGEVLGSYLHEATGWDLAVAAEPDRTEEPDADELEALRELLSR